MNGANNLLAETRAIETRNEFGLSSTTSINIFEVLKFNANISIIKMPIDSDLYGLFIRKGEIQAILINIDTSLGRQYFTAAHEYYHLKYNVNLNGEQERLEKEADTFASYLLIPREALNFHLKKRLTKKNKNIVDISDCLYLENYFKISHQALILRLKLDNHINNKKYEDLKDINIIREARRYGYSVELYTKPKINKNIVVESEYAELAKQALESDIISESRYNEYLIEGGYGDLVFGDRDDE
ncbi:MAG: ImmA/IrrE family metallo-endopeptidase [Halanaerobiales bacterium]|nr:ImmA/IrrE family metallo-endopeptidase [Halanaerobiales bacterium]